MTYAGAVSRLAAYLVDVAVLSVAFWGGSGLVAFLVEVVVGYDLDVQGDRGLAGGLLTVWWFTYFAVSWATGGQTPGMALLGLRVVRPDGGRVSILAAVVRTLVFSLSVAFIGLGFLGIVFQRQRRALHDLVAGTAVTYASITRNG